MLNRAGVRVPPLACYDHRRHHAASIGTTITAAALEEDVASSRRRGGAAEIHDALASGATAAVTMLREDLIEFEPGGSCAGPIAAAQRATHATHCDRRR